MTFTLIIQSLFGPMEPFENEMEPAPATGVKVGVPQPDVVAPVGLATTIAPGDRGKVSVKLAPLMEAVFGLCNVIVKVEEPPALVGFGLKLFAMVIAEGSMILVIR